MSYSLRALQSFAFALTLACDLALPLSHAAEPNPRVVTQITADVVIAGGSTAALAAAFAAAEEGATVALLEPTDWIGGQLTSSAVPAVDEAWHAIEGKDNKVRLDVAAIARDPRNMTPFFRDALKEIGNPGRGWVSRFCFEPEKILTGALEPRAKKLAERLSIYRNTVVKRAEMSADGQRIVALEAITRTPRAGLAAAGYDVLPSQDLPRWYSAKDDERFTKQTLKFTAPVFIDATEWGELLVLARAPYLQGVDREERAEVVNDQLGQAIVYCLVQKIEATPEPDASVAYGCDKLALDSMGYGGYGDRADAWERIWTYRRILSTAEEPRVGDLCLQNWGYSESVGDGGNDYPFGYFLVSMKDAAAECADWQGGVNREVLAGAEQRALAWHEWFRRQAPKPFDPDQIVLAPEVLGTSHGIAKQPYIRDTRRSVGLDGFRLTLADLTADGDATAQTGTAFPDTIALGAYAADIHPLVGYKYPDFVLENHPTLPFCIPFRALTNEKVGNLLVAGKTMAQTFLANSATRLHPIEWSTGTAAGVAAARMSAHAETTSDILRDIQPLRAAVKKHTPVEWTIDAKNAGRAK